ncbi:cobalt ECF transporter T component CbiQ [Methanomicrobium antiquum]|uniref:Cobalt ECF transporter T component CbiQ n=1 Tax=Methanomicrobium antiquum TaxID=487686 RepID=A0AAF0JM71_9EURY|nr:cobalt ECF transporter T component CbiQ [Methanomicrobium antiquum]WFN37539.1 cobalt ECF transporter T component CbiQ [Methanomicrobium antiquum]
MIEELYSIERQAMGNSYIHNMDARIKIIIVFSVIIAMVAYPYSKDIIIPGIFFYFFFLTLWILSKLSFFSYLKRILMILPFGIFIIIFQIFFKNRYYDIFTPIIDLPLDIHIYLESVEFALILLVKFIVCISFIVLLSSTTTMQDMLTGARRLGLPSEFALITGLMIRYLFVFADIFEKVKNSFDTRCFNSFNRSLPYSYRLRTLAYTVGTIFIRSYEQGERTYTSMLCRGYSKDSFLHVGKKKLKPGEIKFLSFSLMLVIVIPIVSYLFSGSVI